MLTDGQPAAALAFASPAVVLTHVQAAAALVLVSSAAMLAVACTLACSAKKCRECDIAENAIASNMPQREAYSLYTVARTLADRRHFESGFA